MSVHAILVLISILNPRDSQTFSGYTCRSGGSGASFKRNCYLLYQVVILQNKGVSCSLSQSSALIIAIASPAHRLPLRE